MLLGAVALVLLMVCANTASLLLARGVSRRRELTLRAALGASHGRLVRQLLTESLCLAAVSGVCGVLVSSPVLDWLRTLLPATLPRADEIRLDGTVLGFGLLLSIATAAFVGLLPALRVARGADLVSTATRASLRHGLVAVEIAVATTLLVGAALLIQSFVSLQRLPLGFDPNGVMTARVSLPRASYTDPGAASLFYRRLLERLEAWPHIEVAAAGSSAPFTSGVRVSAQVRGRMNASPVPDDGVSVIEHTVGAGYFRALGTPILSGREFTDRHRPDEPLVCVVSRRLARELWADRPAVGQVMDWRGRPIEVIGVAGDVRGADGVGPRGGDLDREPPATIYLSSAQFPQTTQTLVVRAAGAPSAVVASIREAVREIDQAQPIYDVRSIEEWVADSGATPRLTATLAGIFAGIALGLAAIGIYGVMAYAVAQRTREIGIRMALGARRADVMGQVLGQSTVLSAAGIALGLAGAAWLTRYLEGMLFGLTPLDATTFGAVAILFAVVATLASYVPARCATRVDPVIALRCD